MTLSIPRFLFCRDVARLRQKQAMPALKLIDLQQILSKWGRYWIFWGKNMQCELSHLPAFSGNLPFPSRWVAPEVFSTNLLTKHSDVWAYGVTMWEMMNCGAMPYQGDCYHMQLPWLPVPWLPTRTTVSLCNININHWQCLYCFSFCNTYDPTHY